jgi:hypothetical protein
MIQLQRENQADQRENDSIAKRKSCRTEKIASIREKMIWIEENMNQLQRESALTLSSRCDSTGFPKIFFQGLQLKYKEIFK